MRLVQSESLKNFGTVKKRARGKQLLRESLLERNKQCQIGQKLVEGEPPTMVPKGQGDHGTSNCDE
jgi:hypothetical protein